MSNSEARREIYDYIKSCKGWVNLDDVVNNFRLCRRIIMDHIVIMVRNKKGLYGGIEKRNKRQKNRMAPLFHGAAKYEILLRVKL